MTRWLIGRSLTATHPGSSPRVGCFAFGCLAVAAWLATGRLPALAQQGTPGTAVQLPTFSQFSTSTSVLVPDRGSAYLGGINRSSSGAVTSGMPLAPIRPFRNSAIGRSQSASGMRVSVWVHDFQAMDEYLLGQPSPGGLASRNAPPGIATTAAGLNNMFSSWDASPAERPTEWASAPEQPAVAAGLGSVAQERERRERVLSQAAREAQQYFERGQTAEAAGKASVARIYYRMAARRAEEPLRGRISERLQAMSARQAGETLADAPALNR